jgi:hypothetical protein
VKKKIENMRELEYYVFPTPYEDRFSANPGGKTMLIKEVSKSNSSGVMLLTGAFIVTATLTMIYFFAN